MAEDKRGALAVVEREEERDIEPARQRFHVGARLLVEIGDREVGARLGSLLVL